MERNHLLERGRPGSKWGIVLMAMCFALCPICVDGGKHYVARAAETPAEDMSAANSAMQGAEKDFQQAEKDFNQAMQTTSAQKTGTQSWSEASGQTSSSTSVTPKKMSDPANPSLYGSPETGYAGTWTDSATGDIITSVIAPTPPATQNSQNYPIVVEPNVGDWGYSGNSGGNWSGGYPQWPVSPDNPGYGTYPPVQGPPFTPPPGPGGFGPNFYPSPPLPDNFHPGYRPLRPNGPMNRPNQPPFSQPGFAPWTPHPGNQWQPGFNGWNGNAQFPNPGQNPPGNWNNGSPGFPNQGFNNPVPRPPANNPSFLPGNGWNQGYPGFNRPAGPNNGNNPAGGWRPGAGNPGFNHPSGWGHPSQGHGWHGHNTPVVPGHAWRGHQ